MSDDRPLRRRGRKVELHHRGPEPPLQLIRLMFEIETMALSQAIVSTGWRGSIGDIPQVLVVAGRLGNHLRARIGFPGGPEPSMPAAEEGANAASHVN